MEKYPRTSQTWPFIYFQFNWKAGITASFLPYPLACFPYATGADVTMSGFVMSWVGSSKYVEMVKVWPDI